MGYNINEVIVMDIRIKERSEIEEEYKWDLSIMYQNIESWQHDFDLVSNKIKEYIKFKGTLCNSASDLLKALKEKDNIDRLYSKLSSYAVRKSDEDTRNADNTRLKNMIAALGTDFNEVTSFFEPEILQISDETLNSFFEEEKDLHVYHHYVYNIFRFKQHTLSLEEEKMLASASEVLMTPSKAFTMLNNADIKFGSIKDEDGNRIELTKGNYSRYISSQNRVVRKRAFKALYKSYCNLRNTFAEFLIGDIKANYFVSKNKKYNNPLEMSLFQNNINTQVYDNVINVVNNNLDKIHKYVKMKKEILGLKEMHMYDFYVDLIREYDLDYEYEDAITLVFKALKPLGEDYIKKARKVFDERWIDVYENKGKLTGAYSSFGYDTPPYILLNYTGKLNSVSTIAHELGHSMHSYYSSQTQPYIYHRYSIFVAEVASNVNEMLLNMYMIDNAKSNQEKLSLINSFLENVKGSIYRQVMFAEFEKTIYECEGKKETLTEEKLSDLYYELNKKYYGKDMVHDNEIRYEWMRIPHFYYNFYVYQYATGLTAAFFIASDLYQGKDNAKEKYLEFLSSGSSDYPLELLRKIGIDMTSEEPLNRIIQHFDKQIDELMALIKEK